VFGNESAAANQSREHAQYADKLSEGTQALLKKYAQSLRLDVYPTHRTGLAPQFVYDNTAKNATQYRSRMAASRCRAVTAVCRSRFPRKA
jgi:hypothetical protein